MSQDEKTTEIETEDDKKSEPASQTDSVYANFLSRLIIMMPLDSIKNIYSVFPEKKVKSTFPLPQFEEYYQKLLYESGFAQNFIQSPDFIKKTTKSIAPTKDEEILIYMTRKFYGNKEAVSLLTTSWRNKLLIQHSETQIKKAIDTIGSLDNTKIGMLLSQYANQLQHEESLSIGENFSDEELHAANVSPELFAWWRQTFHIPEEKPVATDIDNSKLCDAKIEIAERAVEYLDQENAKGLGVFHSLENDYVVMSKHYLIYDGSLPDVDLDLKAVPMYEPSEIGSYGCLLMFKEDCEFYIENVGESPIFVDAIEIRKGEIIYLKDNACIEFGNAALVFKINWRLVSNIRKAMKLA